MSNFSDAMAFRHACKRFDPERKIPAEDLSALLETLRLSPSSFGMEPWRVIVVRSSEFKSTLRPLCWNQAQIESCSELLIFTTDNASVRSDSDYVRTMFMRRGLTPEACENYIARYGSYLEPIENDPLLLENWTAKQCYIAAANIMTHAASLGIDSCPIEGFDKKSVEALLELQSEQKLALMVALGYRVDAQSERKRLPLETLVTFR